MLAEDGGPRDAHQRKEHHLPSRSTTTIVEDEGDPWWYHDITDGVSQLFLRNTNRPTDGGAGEEAEHYDI